MAKKTIVICSSANFYQHAVEIADKLEKFGFDVVLPESAKKMRRLGNYDVKVSRIWVDDPTKFAEKTRLMEGHFKEVADGDAVLTINDEKNGIKGYIGANVLMEMGLAFYLGKPIYVLNPVGADLPFYEEVKAMNCAIVDGKLERIKL